MNFSTWAILVLAVTALATAVTQQSTDTGRQPPYQQQQQQRPQQQKPEPLKIRQGFIDVSKISTLERGTLNTPTYRMYFIYDNTSVISPMHDIPLYNHGKGATQQIFNMVVEIPRWTNAKMEITKQDALNPIRQDTKNGQLRYVPNLFPFHGYMWNYGALPQTWEDPNGNNTHTGAKGDNDPIDVCELGNTVARRGEVIQVKLLGVIGLLDEGETDWKLLAINVRDKLASQLNGLDDIKRIMPGYLEGTIYWFRYYKVPAGKPENHFAFGGKPQDAATALELVEETHQYWVKLMANQSDPGVINIASTTIQHSVGWCTKDQSRKEYNSSPNLTRPAPVPDNVNDRFFLKTTNL